MKSADYPAYAGAITLFLREHGAATPGQLHYHITGKRERLEAALSALVEEGQVEQCGAETAGAYLGQPLYQLKKVAWAAERASIERHLERANEELLGLHRYSVLTYEQYCDVANLLVEACEKLRKHIKPKQ